VVSALVSSTQEIHVEIRAVNARMAACGEPFSSAQFTVRKSHLYDLRVNFRQSYYYWNRNDSEVLPNGLSGLTSNQHWATVRKLGSVNLLIHATNNLRFTFEYYRNTRDGVAFTTRPVDYFGSSAIWGSFARANPYYLVAPLSEEANRVTGGLDYTLSGWNFHYRVGYQRFEDAVNGGNAASPERSINVNDRTTAAELLSGSSWIDSRKLTTPVSEVSYTGRLHPKLEARGGYIFYRYAGPAALDMSFDGIARTDSGGTTDAPYAVSLSTTAKVTEPNHVIDQGFTYKAKEWWSILLDYRYSRFTVDSAAQFRSVNASVISTGDSSNQWRIGRFESCRAHHSTTQNAHTIFLRGFVAGIALRLAVSRDSGTLSAWLSSRLTLPIPRSSAW